MRWHAWHGGLLPRLGGLALIALACFAAAALRRRALADMRLEDDPLAYLLALATFVSASLGTAGLAMGRHLFDKVAVARRWQASAAIE